MQKSVRHISKIVQKRNFSNSFPVKLIELTENVDVFGNMQSTSFQNIKLWEYICPNKFLLRILMRPLTARNHGDRLELF